MAKVNKKAKAASYKFNSEQAIIAIERRKAQQRQSEQERRDNLKRARVFE